MRMQLHLNFIQTLNVKSSTYNVCIYSFWTQSLENKEKNNQVEPVLPVIINLSFEKYTN